MVRHAPGAWSAEAGGLALTLPAAPLLAPAQRVVPHLLLAYLRPVLRPSLLILALGMSSACDPEVRCEPDERKVADQCVTCERYEEQLLGTYAARNTVFMDSTVWGLNAIVPLEDFGLVQILRRDDGVVLTNRSCTGEGMDANLGTYNANSSFLARMGTGEVELEIDCIGGAFRTRTEDKPLGWARGLPEGCGEGVEHSSFAWGSGGQQCACPGTDALDSLPTSYDDCRLDDADANQRPSYDVTLSYDVVGLKADVTVTQVAMGRGYLEGLVDENGPREVGWIDQGSRIEALRCEVASSMTPIGCADYKVTFCPGDVNQLMLMRLPSDTEWNCERLLAMQDELFEDVAKAPVPTKKMCLAQP